MNAVTGIRPVDRLDDDITLPVRPLGQVMRQRTRGIGDIRCGGVGAHRHAMPTPFGDQKHGARSRGDERSTSAPPRQLDIGILLRRIRQR